MLPEILTRKEDVVVVVAVGVVTVVVSQGCAPCSHPLEET